MASIIRERTHGFDFPGYAVTAAGKLASSRAALKICVERINRLYEQGADSNRIGQYVRHWLRWVRGGVRGILSDTLRVLYVLYAPSSYPYQGTKTDGH